MQDKASKRMPENRLHAQAMLHEKNKYHGFCYARGHGQDTDLVQKHRCSVCQAASVFALWRRGFGFHARIFQISAIDAAHGILPVEPAAQRQTVLK